MKLESKDPLLLYLLKKTFPGNKDALMLSFCHFLNRVIGIDEKEKPLFVHLFENGMGSNLQPQGVGDKCLILTWVPRLH